VGEGRRKRKGQRKRGVDVTGGGGEVKGIGNTGI